MRTLRSCPIIHQRPATCAGGPAFPREAVRSSLELERAEQETDVCRQPKVVPRNFKVVSHDEAPLVRRPLFYKHDYTQVQFS